MQAVDQLITNTRLQMLNLKSRQSCTADQRCTDKYKHRKYNTINQFHVKPNAYASKSSPFEEASQQSERKEIRSEGLRECYSRLYQYRQSFKDLNLDDKSVHVSEVNNEILEILPPLEGKLQTEREINHDKDNNQENKTVSFKMDEPDRYDKEPDTQIYERLNILLLGNKIIDKAKTIKAAGENEIKTGSPEINLHLKQTGEKLPIPETKESGTNSVTFSQKKLTYKRGSYHQERTNSIKLQEVSTVTTTEGIEVTCKFCDYDTVSEKQKEEILHQDQINDSRELEEVIKIPRQINSSHELEENDQNRSYHNIVSEAQKEKTKISYQFQINDSQELEKIKTPYPERINDSQEIKKGKNGYQDQIILEKELKKESEITVIEIQITDSQEIEEDNQTECYYSVVSLRENEENYETQLSNSESMRTDISEISSFSSSLWKGNRTYIQSDYVEDSSDFSWLNWLRKGSLLIHGDGSNDGHGDVITGEGDVKGVTGFPLIKNSNAQKETHAKSQIKESSGSDEGSVWYDCQPC